jgi:two-component system, LytTR family, response regulator
MKEMKKVIIVDDEAAGRTLINQYLKEHENLILIDEANNGVDAVKIINEFKPDIVFMDIQMPGLTGFEVLKHLEEIPQIIFSTAYDKYALEAFEVHAVDYLLKPYTRERFNAAIQKLRSTDNLSFVKPLAESIINTKTYPEKILVNQNQKLVAVTVSNIVYITAERDYSELVTHGQKHLSNFGISVLEQKLDPQKFIRVHRSAIINIDFIKEIQKNLNSYDIIMQNGHVVRVSRSYMENIKKLIF